MQSFDSIDGTQLIKAYYMEKKVEALFTDTVKDSISYINNLDTEAHVISIAWDPHSSKYLTVYVV